MSIGGEFQYDLVRGPKTRFFGVSALSYQYWGSKGNDIGGPFRLGVGAGGEFQIQNSFSITAEGLFTFFSDGRVIPLPSLPCIIILIDGRIVPRYHAVAENTGLRNKISFISKQRAGEQRQ